MDLHQLAVFCENILYNIFIVVQLNKRDEYWDVYGI